MSNTTNRTEDQESSGFRIAMKVLGTLHRWLYRASGGKLGKAFFWFSDPLANHDRAQDGTISDLATHLPAR